MLFEPKTLIGLDIGTSAIKLVVMEELKGAYKLNNFGIAKLPKETIVNGVIIHSEPIVNSIKALLSNLKIDNKYAAISVSGHPVIIKKITLPMMSEEELNNIKKINNNHRLENKLLREEIDLLKYNNLYIEEKARKELGLIKNNEIIYHIKKKHK